MNFLKKRPVDFMLVACPLLTVMLVLIKLGDKAMKHVSWWLVIAPLYPLALILIIAVFVWTVFALSWKDLRSVRIAADCACFENR